MADPKISASSPDIEPYLVLVEAEMERLDPRIRAAMAKRKVTVVVCKDNPTDYAPRLLNMESPANWGGRSWADAAGAYLPDTKEVVIGLKADGSGYRLPVWGDKHASHNLVLHEAMHGHDYSAGQRFSGDRQLRQAAHRDLGGRDDYWSRYVAQPAEAYAESAARYFGGGPDYSPPFTALNHYWDNFDYNVLDMPDTFETLRAAEAHSDVFTHEMPDGGVLVIMTAEQPGVVIGHLAVRLHPGDTHEVALIDWLESQGLVPGFINAHQRILADR